MKGRVILLLLLCLSFLLTACQSSDTPISDRISTEAVDLSDSVSDKEMAEEGTEAKTEAKTESDTEPPLDQNESDDLEDAFVKRDYSAINFADMKCMWLSQFDLSGIYRQGGVQRGESSFRELMAVVLDNVVANGINTVILQVRPNADSMYPSKLYPPSAYVVGSYGKGFSYDPVSVIVEMAHTRRLSIHAWINPLRAMSDADIKLVMGNYTIRQWYNDSELRGKYIVKVGSNWYLNPAYAEVRELILNGAAEVLQSYDFDGLHMDDYFYPTTDQSFDLAAYSQYCQANGKLLLADFRREALNKLVGTMYENTKQIDPNALYGISPAGNYNTVYNSHYADVLTWCSTEGYIDYICPQVYFGLEHSSFDFIKTSQMWQSYIKTDSVKLIIGMSLGKAQSGVDNYAGAGKNEWSEHKDVLQRCLAYTLELDRCVGVAYFCYQYFYDPISALPNAATQAERDHFVPLLKEITWQG